MTLPNIKWGRTPWTLDENGLTIYDADQNRLLDIRGWGALTGGGGLALNHDVAEAAQIQLAKHIIELVNASSKKTG